MSTVTWMRSRDSVSNSLTLLQSSSLLLWPPRFLYTPGARCNVEMATSHLQSSAKALDTLLAWSWIFLTSCWGRLGALPDCLTAGARDLDWSITEHSASHKEGSSLNQWDTGLLSMKNFFLMSNSVIFSIRSLLMLQMLPEKSYLNLSLLV